MYLYETHCHTRKISRCASSSAEDIVNLYLANGYDGIFITDHFLNGNTTVHRDFPDASREEKIAAFCEGYKEVKKVAGTRLQVFFGLEFSYYGSDLLIYGWDEEQLLAFKDILDMPMSAIPDFCRETSALCAQAHPFREAGYIDHTRLYPTTEGVEIFNASQNELCNTLGEFYAKAYGKIAIGGSDCHHVTQKILSGVAFEERIHSAQEFIEALRQGKGQVIKQENVLVKNQ